MRSLLITGANRGLGLELVKQFLNHSSAKPEILIATARKPADAKVSKYILQCIIGYLQLFFYYLRQRFPTWGTRTPRGT